MGGTHPFRISIDCHPLRTMKVRLTQDAKVEQKPKFQHTRKQFVVREKWLEPKWLSWFEGGFNQTPLWFIGGKTNTLWFKVGFKQNLLCFEGGFKPNPIWFQTGFKPNPLWFQGRKSENQTCSVHFGPPLSPAVLREGLV